MPRCKSNGQSATKNTADCSSVVEETKPLLRSPISSRTRRRVRGNPPKTGTGEKGESLVTSPPRRRLPKPKATRKSRKDSGVTDIPMVEPMEIAEYDIESQRNGMLPQSKSRKIQAASPVEEEEEDTCPVCMCPPTDIKQLDKCGHKFCTPCIEQCFTKMKPACPVCGTLYGKIIGNMPSGTMHHRIDAYTQLPGYEGHGTIMIEYNFPNGIQTAEHPHPGRQYYGTHRSAFLPNNAEGQKVLRLLTQAFESRVTFTVGRSATTGLDDQVIWNDVHHKTRVHGGPCAFGYPDPTYLSRVQEELASKGVF